MTTDTMTRDGQAQATYEAFDEPVPPVFQAMTSPNAAFDYVSLRVMNVLPKWSKLEAIVRLGNPNLAAGKASLTVYYYKWPQLTESPWPARETLFGIIKKGRDIGVTQPASVITYPFLAAML